MVLKIAIKGILKLIEKPENWTRGSFCVKKEDGTRAYCAIGNVVGYGRGYEEARDYILEHLPKGYANVATWNDSSTHADVVRLLKRLAK